MTSKSTPAVRHQPLAHNLFIKMLSPVMTISKHAVQQVRGQRKKSIHCRQEISLLLIKQKVMMS